FVEMISCRQGDLDQLVARGYTAALVEERQRYCFLVDRQCAVSKHFSLYHDKVKDLLMHKLVSWQNSCSDPSRIPERVWTLVKQTATSNSGPVIAEPGPANKPLRSPPEPAPLAGESGLSPSHISTLQVPNGGSQKRHAMEMVPVRFSECPSSARDSISTLPLPPKTNDTSSGTLPPRKTGTEDHLDSASGDRRTLPRAPPTVRLDRPRVRAVFAHTAGENETLLSFEENDIITLLVSEAKDGWHYGESEVTNRKGWFPFSYTQPLGEDSIERRSHCNLQASKFNSSSTGRLDEVGVSCGSETSHSTRRGNSSLPSSNQLRIRPFSMMNPDLSQLSADFGKPGSHSSR
ncbi:BAR/IMD domain-containing adapter protein 2-like, partial [Heterodontus francisci]|uniref:BAR/IMD domain-containing adapter protein 2-like n=1 Tax=Heterodontus francisci TaxID=7792 RepID=UPI00355B84DF